MKFENKKAMAMIMAVTMATGFTGCSNDENSSVQSDSNTEKDLLTPTTSIDIWSAQESLDSSLNDYDTSKPIEVTEESNSSSNSDDGTSSDDTNSSTSSDLTDEKSESETSKSDDTTSVPSDSSKPSTSNGVALDKIVIADANKRVYYDKDGNPMPDDFDPSNGGFYDKSGNYTMTEEEYAEYVAMSNKHDEEIRNGTFNIADTMTDEQLAEIEALLGIR